MLRNIPRTPSVSARKQLQPEHRRRDAIVERCDSCGVGVDHLVERLDVQAGCAVCGRKFQGVAGQCPQLVLNVDRLVRRPSTGSSWEPTVTMAQRPIRTRTRNSDGPSNRHGTRRRPRPKCTHRRGPSTHRHCAARGRALPSSPTLHQLAGRPTRGSHLARRNRCRQGTGRGRPSQPPCNSRHESLHRRDHRCGRTLRRPHRAPPPSN